MEAITVNQEKLLRNYLINTIERLNTEGDLPNGELVDELEDAACRARKLASSNPTNVVAAYRELFRQGYTMTLLPDSIFSRIEQLYHRDKDFVIIITDAQGEYLGAIPGRDATW